MQPRRIASRFELNRRFHLTGSRDISLGRGQDSTDVHRGQPRGERTREFLHGEARIHVRRHVAHRRVVRLEGPAKRNHQRRGISEEVDSVGLPSLPVLYCEKF